MSDLLFPAEARLTGGCAAGFTFIRFTNEIEDANRFVVEHWDVRQPLRETSANPNGMF